MTDEQKPPSDSGKKPAPDDEKPLTPVDEQKSNPAGLLLEQYKLLVDYRKFLGDQFLKMTGVIMGISTVLIGLLSGKSPVAVKLALGLGAIIFFLLAYVGYRLRVAEDTFVDAMHAVEGLLDSNGYKLTGWPSATKDVGARIAIVAFLSLVGLGFLVYLFYLGVS